MKNKPKPNTPKKFWQVPGFNQPNQGPQKQQNQYNAKSSAMGRRTSRGR